MRRPPSSPGRRHRGRIDGRHAPEIAAIDHRLGDGDIMRAQFERFARNSLRALSALAEVLKAPSWMRWVLGASVRATSTLRLTGLAARFSTWGLA
jgi:hypothetical protein